MKATVKDKMIALCYVHTIEFLLGIGQAAVVDQYLQAAPAEVINHPAVMARLAVSHY